MQTLFQTIYEHYIDHHIEMIRSLGPFLTHDSVDYLLIRIQSDISEDFEADVASRMTTTVEAFQLAWDKFPECQKEAEIYYKARADSRFRPAQGQGPLGKGTFGTVTVVEEVANKRRLYAHKRIKAGSGTSQLSSIEDVENEIRVMENLIHHHITRLELSARDTDGFSLYILPVAERSLHDYLKVPGGKKKYSEDQIYSWIGCLASAIDYAHRSNIIHRDVKPANILIDERGDRIYLTDFGLAEIYDRSINASMGSAVVGTPKYLAPECKPGAQRKDIEKVVDEFALGCVYTEILSYLAEASMTIDQFDDVRRDDWKSVEFRECLGQDQLETFLTGLEDIGERAGKVVKLVFRLLWGKKARLTIAEVLKELNEHGFRCKRCPR